MIRRLWEEGTTLNQVLAAAGYATRPAPGLAGALGAKEIVDLDGQARFSGMAWDVWKWLRQERTPCAHRTQPGLPCATPTCPWGSDVTTHERIEVDGRWEWRRVP